MPTLVTHFALTGTKEEVSPARHRVIDKVRAWGVPLDDETVDAIGLVASELITNAVIHGSGPITVTLSHSSGSLVIDVLDTNSTVPKLGCSDVEDEGGRGLVLVDFLAARSGWKRARGGKHVWAEIALPKSTPAVGTAVLSQLSGARSPSPRGRTVPSSYALATA
ncbi:ATP-binding protein [Streptomyces cellostaticus]|uniref:ATP-binding protein n=1 Tax=Streptomyces cellostaticus TaxID=67285 RepID=UPI00202605E0|nr:ATP-binding protein [Streptomyces cellostaticus]